MLSKNSRVGGLLSRGGLLLSCLAVFLQIAVFLQPLLPKQYQVAPVCETITQALLFTPFAQVSSAASTSHHAGHAPQHHQPLAKRSDSHHHDATHQCQYCTVYGNLVLPLDLHIKEVLDRIQVRLLAFQQTFGHVWFVLQRLYLLPQGRAPPFFI